MKYRILAYRREERDRYRHFEVKHSLFDSYEACTVVVAVHPYDAVQNFFKPSHPPGRHYGFVDGFAWEKDYHVYVQAAMRELLEELSSRGLHTSGAEIHVDSKDYNDREVAYYAGLGRFGRNHMLIHSEYGTRFFIGYAILPEYQPFLADAPAPETLTTEYPPCRRCGRCRACPAGICGMPVEEGRKVDMNRCISAISQSKGSLDPAQCRLLHDRLYGCDTCQRVCPANRGGTVSDAGYLDLYELFSLSNRQFKKKYGSMGFSWLPLRVFIRNGIIILGNLGGEEERNKLLALREKMSENPEALDTFQPYFDYSFHEITKRLEKGNTDSERIEK